ISCPLTSIMAVHYEPIEIDEPIPMNIPKVLAEEIDPHLRKTGLVQSTAGPETEHWTSFSGPPPFLSFQKPTSVLIRAAPYDGRGLYMRVSPSFSALQASVSAPLTENLTCTMVAGRRLSYRFPLWFSRPRV